MDRGWPHNFERKIAIRSKTHRAQTQTQTQAQTRSAPETKQRGRKRNIAFL